MRWIQFSRGQRRFASMTDIPKKIAGRYHIKELLGKGGFGAVYRAEDELEDREVALKVIRTDASLDPRGTRSRSLDGHSSSQSSSRSRFGRYSRAGTRTNRKSFTSNPSPAPNDDITEAFKDEFLRLTRLHHPNLAAVYEFGRCDEIDGVYFTQELVEGVYLGEFLEGKSREVVVDVFVQLARVLDYIHALGMVHEDIKPTNVLVTNHNGQPQAKLIDFGLARVLRKGPEGEAEEDDTDTVLGTPGFSAPEKIRGEKTDSRSDIYSLAATMYAAIRGSKPFPSRDFEEALRAQKDWRPELAGALLKQSGPVVAELIGRMLNPDPERRPQSARSIVLELLRREPSHIRDRQDNKEDRAEFARVFVEHLTFADRQSYLDLLLTRATDVMLPDLTPDAARSHANQLSHGLIRTIIVEAPEGMGKSRLLGEVRREIQIGGGLFVESSCWTTERTALGAFGPVVLQLATALGERSKVIADYAELLQLARDRGTDESAAGRLMEFLIAACRERPYCLHLSELSKGLSEFVRFEQLARAIDHNKAPLLLCGTSTPHTKLGPLLATLARDQLAETWSLRPFTRREMHFVLQGVLGETPAIRELVKALDNLTGGHPLSFRETLRVLIEEGILARDADDWVFRANSPAAQNLHQTLAQRSEARLDSQGVSAWEIASILYLIEAPIEEAQLAQLSDLRKSRFRRAIDRLEGEGLIVRTATNHITLAHESVREAVRRRYADSLDETRLDLATRIDDLEVIDSNFVFLKVRLLDDAAEGLEAVDALEEAAAGLFAVGQAQLGAVVLERLIRRLRMHGGTAAIPRLLEAKLLLLNQGGGALDDPRREIAHYEAGILLAELMRDFRAQSLFWLGLADRSTAEVDDDMELTLYRLARAAAAAERARDRVLELRISNRRAEVLLSAGEIEQAGSYSRKAMEILDLDDANDVDVCHIIGVRLRCLSLSGQLGEARRLHEMGKPIAARVPVVQRQSYLSGIAFLAVLGGDPDRAIPETVQAIEQLRAARVPRLLHTPLHNLGDLYLRAGQLEPAAMAFNEAIDIAALFGVDQAVHLNRGFLGYTLARLGKVEEGAVKLAAARRSMQQGSGDQVTLQQLRLLDAEVAHMMGQTPRARRELEEMLADFHSTNEISFVHWAQDALARIERDIGTNFIEATNIPELASAPDEDTVRTRPIG
jgi:serine/threonine protein kinase/tetratricopeptide (TPR) repeat protein